MLSPVARGFSLLAVGQFGKPAVLPMVEKAFADSRVFQKDSWPLEGGQRQPVETLVSDVAIAAALRLSEQHPVDYGFPLLEMYKERSPDTLAKYHLLGFYDGNAREAAHTKAKEWLAKQPQPPHPKK